MALLVGCDGGESGAAGRQGGAAPAGDTVAPSFEPAFPAVEGELMTQSSPDLTDLDRDGVADIVFGSGVDRVRPEQSGYVFSQEPAVPGYVTAISGATNEVLWNAANPGEAHTTPRFVHVDGDGVPDVIMGGREGAFSAFSGVDGSILWRVDPSAVAETPVPYNFFTPAVIRDVDDDGVEDLVVVYSGDDTRLPGEPRDPGYVVVLSGADGSTLAAHRTPDRKESYSAIITYRRADGSEWIVFGTGGETDAGAAFRAPVASLLDGSFDDRAQRVVPAGGKGLIAPATIVELTGDEEPDLALSTFGGRLMVVDGASAEVVWDEQPAENEEAYHQAAAARIGDGRLGLVVSRGIGVFPRYAGSVHRLYDASDGSLLYEYKDTRYPGGAPLAVDLDGDDVDEVLFFSQQYPFGEGGRIHVLQIGSEQLITHEVPTNLASTPRIADLRGSGSMELIVPTWRIAPSEGTPDWRDLQWRLLRLDLSAPEPASISWGGYMGTSTDGHYPASTAAQAPR